MLIAGLLVITFDDTDVRSVGVFLRVLNTHWVEAVLHTLRFPWSSTGALFAHAGTGKEHMRRDSS